MGKMRKKLSMMVTIIMLFTLLIPSGIVFAAATDASITSVNLVASTTQTGTGTGSTLPNFANMKVGDSFYARIDLTNAVALGFDFGLTYSNNLKVKDLVTQDPDTGNDIYTPDLGFINSSPFNSTYKCLAIGPSINTTNRVISMVFSLTNYQNQLDSNYLFNFGASKKVFYVQFEVLQKGASYVRFSNLPASQAQIPTSNGILIINGDTSLSAVPSNKLVYNNSLNSFTIGQADTTAPVITLNGSSTVNVVYGTTYTDAGATVTDDQDTRLVATTTYSNNGAAVPSIDTTVPGTYIVHYNISDTAGNPAAEMTRTVIVAEAPDTQAPATGKVYITTDKTSFNTGDIITLRVVSKGLNITNLSSFSFVLKYDRTKFNAVKPVSYTPYTNNTNLDTREAGTIWGSTYEADPINDPGNYQPVFSSPKIAKHVIYDSSTGLIDYERFAGGGASLNITNATDGNPDNPVTFTNANGEIEWYTVRLKALSAGTVSDLDSTHISFGDPRSFPTVGSGGFAIGSLSGTNGTYNSTNYSLSAIQLPDPDTLAVAAAKSAVENAAYTMTQAAVTDEAAVKAAVEAKIGALSLGGVTAAVTKVAYAPAVAGDEGNPSGTNGTYTFTVGLTKGSATDTTATLTMTITATAFDVTAANAAAVATAKALVGGTTYTMTQAAATDEAAVKAAIEAKIGALSLGGVAATVTKVGYTPAVAGDAGTPSGTNGTYTFTVGLSKGAIADTTATLTMTITATAFDVAAANEAAVTAAKGLVAGATYTMTQAAAIDEAAVKAAVEAKIGTLSLGGIAAAVTKVGYTPAVAGDEGNPSGTNGTYTFTVGLTKGSAEDSTVTLTMTITATAFDVAAANAAAVAAAKGLVAGSAYTMTQAAATDEAAVKAAVEAKIGTLSLGGVAATVTKAGYTPAVAGDEGNPSGTNGTYTFTVGLTKGSAADTTATLTITITATAFDVAAANAAAVAVAKGLVAGATYAMTQAAATNEAAVKTAIEAKIGTLSLGGVTATVTKVGYTPAVAGDVGNSNGTNGTYTFIVGLTKGAATDTTATLTMTITAAAASVYTVNGRIMLEGDDLTAGHQHYSGDVKIELKQGNTVIYTVYSSNSQNDDVNGTFSISNVVSGSYTLVFSKPGYLKRSFNINVTANKTVTSSNNLFNNRVYLYTGDVVQDADDVIGAFDLNLMLSQYGKNISNGASFNPVCDIVKDQDNTIGAFDLNLILKNYGYNVTRYANDIVIN